MQPVEWRLLCCVLLPQSVALSAMSHYCSVCWLKTHCLCSHSTSLLLLFSLHLFVSQRSFVLGWAASFSSSSSSLLYVSVRVNYNHLFSGHVTDLFVKSCCQSWYLPWFLLLYLSYFLKSSHVGTQKPSSIGQTSCWCFHLFVLEPRWLPCCF